MNTIITIGRQLDVYKRQMQGGKIFFLIITPIILALVVYAMYKMPSVGKYRILHILLACVAVGAVGNMIDRIRLDYVVDFIYISLIDFPIFNAVSYTHLDVYKRQIEDYCISLK